MTATTPGDLSDPESAGDCWCCGSPNPPSALLHLGNRSEVTVCLRCAEFLAHRARERRDELNPSLAGRARDVLRAGRRTVMDHGWQGLPVVGPVLRRLGRHLP